MRKRILDIENQNMLCIVNGNLLVIIDIGSEKLHLRQIRFLSGKTCNICIQHKLCIADTDLVIEIDVAAQVIRGGLNRLRFDCRHSGNGCR